MRLYVEPDAMAKSFIKSLEKELKILSEELETEIERHQGEVGRKYGKPLLAVKKINDGYRISIRVNRQFLADNYGTGTKMDVHNVGLFSDFMLNNWNEMRPQRPGVPIMGRKKGSEYINFEGRKIVSSGAMAGVNIEHRIFRQKNGGWIEIVPIVPSKAFETAMQWYKVDYLPTALKRAVKNWNPAKVMKYVN